MELVHADDAVVVLVEDGRQPVAVVHCDGPWDGGVGQALDDLEQLVRGQHAVPVRVDLFEAVDGGLLKVVGQQEVDDLRGDPVELRLDDRLVLFDAINELVDLRCGRLHLLEMDVTHFWMNDWELTLDFLIYQMLYENSF